MILKNGKFYDAAGNVVPLEIGNWDQIKLLESRKAMLDGCCALGDITCLCGTPVYRDKEPNGEMAKKRHSKHCVVCVEEYEFYWHKEPSHFGPISVPAVRLIDKK